MYADALAPKNPVVLNNLGVAFARVGDFNRSTQYLRAALDADSTYATARFALGRSLRCEAAADDAPSGGGGGGAAKRNAAYDEMKRAQREDFDGNRDREAVFADIAALIEERK